VWTSIIVFLLALAYFVAAGNRVSADPDAPASASDDAEVAHAPAADTSDAEPRGESSPVADDDPSDVRTNRP
jgi:hypothetical protein